MLLIDILLICLLTAAIYYCYLLNNRIIELQNSKKDFISLIKEFDVAIARAESSISDLTNLSKDTSAKIYKATEKAQFLVNDVTFMSDMGSDVANRLEKAISNAQVLEKKNFAMTNSITTHATASSNPKQDIENIIARFANKINA